MIGSAQGATLKEELLRWDTVSVAVVEQLQVHQRSEQRRWGCPAVVI
jgi:hypothetical protein